MVATGKPGHEARKPFLESALANFNNLTQAFMLRLFAIDLLLIKNKIKFEISKRPFNAMCRFFSLFKKGKIKPGFRIRIRRIRMFLACPDPDPHKFADPDPDPGKKVRK